MLVIIKLDKLDSSAPNWAFKNIGGIKIWRWAQPSCPKLPHANYRGELNLAVQASTIKPANLNPHQYFWLYGTIHLILSQIHRQSGGIVKSSEPMHVHGSIKTEGQLLLMYIKHGTSSLDKFPTSLLPTTRTAKKQQGQRVCQNLDLHTCTHKEGQSKKHEALYYVCVELIIY